MNPRHVEILSSLMDGEPVDPDVLEQALHEADAVPLLVHAVRLRLAVQEQMATPGPESRRRCEAAMRAEAVRLGGRWRRLVLAAAAVAAMAGAGTVGVEIGARWGPLLGPVPAAVPVRAVDEVPSPASDTPMRWWNRESEPEATVHAAEPGTHRTVRFEPSRNWHEGGSEP